VAEATTFVDSTRLIVGVVDLQHCPSSPCPVSNGTNPQYFLQVKNGALVSEKRELVITAGATSVTTMDPASAWQGDQPRVTIHGTGLTGSVLEAAPPGGAFVTSTSPVASDTAVSGIVDLIGSPPGSAPAGTWNARLRFTGSGATTAAFSLRVDSNQAVITATPVPAGGQTGLTVPVTLAVNNLRPPQSGVRVRFFDPGGSFTVDLVPTFPDGTHVAAALPLAGRPSGVYALAVVNPNGAQPSTPFNFTVLPGVPTLATVACIDPASSAEGACASATSAHQQAKPVHLRLTGTNFAKPDAAGNNGSQVRVSNAALGITSQPIPTAAVTVTSATQLDVELDTTLAVASATAAYSLQIWNQGGALQSNTLAGAFLILP
jgi:hypothetical protein